MDKVKYTKHKQRNVIGKNLISLQPSYINRTMSEISDAIQAKCLAFGDRIIKLNDYLLEQASLKYDVRCQKYNRGSKQHQPSDISHHTSRVPVHLQSVAALANQLLRSVRFSSTTEGKVNVDRRSTF